MKPGVGFFGIRNHHSASLDANMSTLTLILPLAVSDRSRIWSVCLSLQLQEQLIAQIKMVTKVLFLYIPLPMFWALFDQQVMWNYVFVQLHLANIRGGTTMHRTIVSYLAPKNILFQLLIYSFMCLFDSC